MRKIKWGVMGTAYIFERDTARGMSLAKNCELTAIAGRSMQKAEAFREEYGFKRAYGSYEELLEDPEVEAVYIPLPNTFHYEWTIRALQHGKHVLCEKPLAPSAKQARDVPHGKREPCDPDGGFRLSAQPLYQGNQKVDRGGCDRGAALCGGGADHVGLRPQQYKDA